MIRSIEHVAIAAKNTEALARWYCDTLGFTVVVAGRPRGTGLGLDQGTWFVGPPEGDVRKVALACGAAGEFMPDAARMKADVFVTGEMRFHDFYDARTRGVSLVVAGHYATERFALEELARTLGERFGDVEVWASERETDPVGWV